MLFEKVNLCGVDIHCCTLEQATEFVINYAKNRGTPASVVTPNAHHLVILQKDEAFRDIYRESVLVVADGVPLVWASRFLGQPLPERVNGTDLFEKTCAVAAKEGLKVFFLGGRPGAADAAAHILRNRYPILQICGTYCPPFGFEKDQKQLEKLNRAILDCDPDILYVGLGAPKQEKWIHAHSRALGVPISLGIGVSFELISGMVKRAPIWMQKFSLEWFFRLIMEPRRLWRRYLVTNTIFLSKLLFQLSGLRKY